LKLTNFFNLSATGNINIKIDRSYDSENYNYIPPYLQLYTPADRKSIAIENLSGIPNCFNNKIGLQLMKPHQNLILKTSYQFIIK
jgi:aldose 1-epimerase